MGQTWFELIGWVGSLLLGLCALPQTVHVIRTRTAGTLTWNFLGMWSSGEILCLIYMLPTGKWPIIANYLLNLTLLGIMLGFKAKDFGAFSACSRIFNVVFRKPQ
jgi:uncharacterized protein with PQ loop repeat